jgi:hypothetical protein
MKSQPIILKTRPNTYNGQVVLRGSTPREQLVGLEKKLRADLGKTFPTDVMFFHVLSTQQALSKAATKSAKSKKGHLSRSFTTAAIEVGHALHIGHAICGETEVFNKVYGCTQAILRMQNAPILRVPIPAAILKIKDPKIRARRKGEFMKRISLSIPKKFPHLFDKQLGIEYAMAQLKHDAKKTSTRTTPEHAAAKRVLAAMPKKRVTASKKTSTKKPMKKGGKC